MREASAPGRATAAALLDPAAVTIVGASPGSFFASSLLDNLLDASHPFGGTINLVSRTRASVAGISCVPSLDLVAEPGVVYLLVPAGDCLGILRSATGRIDGVVVITSGFTPEQEVELADWAASSDVPLLGPNCMGVLAPQDGFFGYAGPLPPIADGPIGLVMQSGGMLSGVLGALAGRGLGVASAFSYGNAASLDFFELAVLQLEESGVDTVLLYAESMRDVRDLRDAGARARALGKQLVLVQGGQSEAGSRAAQSHTGMLATSARIVAGVARQAGIIVCRDLEEAVWVLEALATPGLRGSAPRAGGIAVLSSSGGGAVAMADAAERAGVVLEGPDNPVDVGAGVMNRPEEFAAIVRDYAARHPVLVHVAGVGLPGPRLPAHTAVARLVVDAAQSAGAAVVLCAIVGAPLPPETRWDGVVYATSAREGIVKAGALAALLDPSGSTVSQVDRSPVTQGRVELVTGTSSRELLAGLRVAWPESAEIDDLPAGLESAADRVGFPMVVKVEQLAHRLKAGGLIRSVPDLTVLSAAVAFLRARFGDAPISLHREVEHDAEFILGFVRSAEHGVLLSFGMGGSDVGDSVVFASAPLGYDEIVALVSPFVAAGDLRVVVELVQDVAALATTHPELGSLDLNPIAMGRDGLLYALDSKLEVTR
ncbi:MAG: coA binding domain protein [Rhodoglobus sp.]|nr:coA binding domain protein [Rhodoglobus sp.]